MSSEAESKGAVEGGGGCWRWASLLALLLVGGLLARAALLDGSADRVVLSRPVYEELLQALGRLGPGAGAPSSGIHLGFDARFGAKAEELRRGLGGRPYPTFEELYALVVNRPYDAAHSIWRTFPNPYQLKPNFKFPFSNLRESHVERALELLGRAPAFVVEVGSFHGHSAILQAEVLDKHGLANVPLLCVDPWTGDLGMLLYREDWDKKLTPGELADGRSTSYWQFMVNVKFMLDEGKLGPKHIVPLAATSVVAARFLMALGLSPDIVYLDSAHEADETYAELALYYHVLAGGGVIYGDDYSWESVRHDVERFATERGLRVVSDSVTWTLQKPQGPGILAAQGEDRGKDGGLT